MSHRCHTSLDIDMTPCAWQVYMIISVGLPICAIGLTSHVYINVKLNVYVRCQADCAYEYITQCQVECEYDSKNIMQQLHIYVSSNHTHKLCICSCMCVVMCFDQLYMSATYRRTWYVYSCHGRGRLSMLYNIITICHKYTCSYVSVQHVQRQQDTCTCTHTYHITTSVPVNK